ncbi:hypothetical protein H2248_012036 [Termitomyces sp. 'cryptogamus']|nr:hypothetical protein H2248_012036 [Termitomyces sp. 'cryptogamus']
MFLPSVQTSTVSLFSSTNSEPLQLFRKSVDTSLPVDSCIHFLHDQLSQPKPKPPSELISPPTNAGTDYSLDQTVLHIQSPTIRTTFIQSPPVDGPSHSDGRREKLSDLGIKHPWMHIQVRNLDKEWALEVGLVDQSARLGILRLSTFQKHPRLRLSSNAYPLLHLPISFPSPSTHSLTAWSTLTLNLPSYLPYFSSPKLMRDVDTEGVSRGMRNEAPGGSYSHVAYVRVYATCRLRRIWFSEGGPGQKVPWEFELYGYE